MVDLLPESPIYTQSNYQEYPIVVVSCPYNLLNHGRCTFAERVTRGISECPSSVAVEIMDCCKGRIAVPVTLEAMAKIQARNRLFESTNDLP